MHELNEENIFEIADQIFMNTFDLSNQNEESLV